jgi:hypothetical protein
MRAGPLPADPDGGYACALAFSTLLSSQGADAHHPRPLGLIRGNPANLPVLWDLVNRVCGTWLTWLHDVLRAYPHLTAPVPRGRDRWEGYCWPLETNRLRGRPCLPGQDERLGSKGDLVKSRAVRRLPGPRGLPDRAPLLVTRVSPASASSRRSGPDRDYGLAAAPCDADCGGFVTE